MVIGHSDMPYQPASMVRMALDYYLIGQELLWCTDEATRSQLQSQLADVLKALDSAIRASQG